MEKWLDDYLLSKKGAETDFQADWQAHRYLLKNKMFAMHGGDKEGVEILTLKLAPAHCEEIRELYKGKVTAGYYMNKTHWISIYLEENLPEEVLKKCVDGAYELILGSFSKKVQAEITG
jgi:predicted DNA-binding protein (MmcQ/YjbR family)